MVYKSRQSHNSNFVAPPRPLARIIARARTQSENGAGSENVVVASENNRAERPAKRPSNNAYCLEVNEYVAHRKRVGAEDDKPAAMPCVTIRDLQIFIKDQKQRRVWIPMELSGDILKYLKTCRIDKDGNIVDATSSPESHDSTKSEKKKPRQYDVNLLKPSVFIGKETKKVVSLEYFDGRICLRTFMDSPAHDEYNHGDQIEIVELRNELMDRLVRFLSDVVLRYSPPSKDIQIPSLYSYSGERRFYYDLRETRWGTRLHISQVTDLHRNVIGIPLESVVNFRDRLSQAIALLRLDDEELDKKPSPTQRRGRTNPPRGRRYRRPQRSNHLNHEQNVQREITA